MACKFTLAREQVSWHFHDPYIQTGYRQPKISALECVRSAFVWRCNESFNILSHLVTTLFYLWLLIDCCRELDTRDMYTWPLLCHALGNICFSSMSTLAHMFNSMSEGARHRCFYFDYAAISVYTVGASQAFYFYTRPLHSGVYLFNHPYMFNVLCLLISLASNQLSCISRTRLTSIKYLVRTSGYIAAYAWSTSPYFYRLLACDTAEDCDRSGYSLFITQTVFLGLTALANVLKLPERVVPRKFDHLGQSHHLMHVFIAIGCYIQFEFTKHEALARKHLLSNQNELSYISAYFMIAATLGNISIASLTSTEEAYAKKTE